MTLKIRHKVLLPALAVIIVLLAQVAYSFYSISLIKSQADRLKDYHLKGSVQVRDIRLQLDEVVRQGRLSAVSTDPGFLEQFVTARGELDHQLEALIARDPVADPAQLRFKQSLEALYAALSDRSPAAEAGLEKAKTEAYGSLRDLDERYTRRFQRSVEVLAQIGKDAGRSTLYALVTGVIVSVVVWVLILLSLSRPLKNLVEGTGRVAQGRFDEPIPVLSQDELGMLSDSFNRMAANLSELDRMKAEFVATASHELKTPLACIKGFASLLRSGSRGALGEEQRATVLQIEEQVDQMTDFVSQLLDLSRLRAGRMAMKTRSLPADAFFGSVARGFDGVAERRGIKYEVRISRELPTRMQADPDRLREVVYNLLGNAFKFTSTGGTVGLDVEGDSEWIRVAVSDTGPGISQEDLPFIFEKYYRGAGQDEVRRNEGAGLGLAISRGIIERHGGRIWVESGQGQGSRLVFRIPTASVGVSGSIETKRAGPQEVAAKEN